MNFLSTRRVYYIRRTISAYNSVEYLSKSAKIGAGRGKVKVKWPRYRPAGPRGVQEVKASRFVDTRYMKVERS